MAVREQEVLAEAVRLPLDLLVGGHIGFSADTILPHVVLVRILRGKIGVVVDGVAGEHERGGEQNGCASERGGAGGKHPRRARAVEVVERGLVGHG